MSLLLTMMQTMQGNGMSGEKLARLRERRLRALVDYAKKT